MQLEGKNVVYVGGFGGIGYESCKCFIGNGIAKLVICDLAADAAKLAALQLLDRAVAVHFIRLDVTDKQNIADAFAEAHTKLGSFDVVVNGSGIMNERLIERTLDVNLLGPINCSLAAMRYMDKSQLGNGGLIANVSSLVGLDAYGAYAVYTATKYGIVGFTRALSDPFYYERTNIAFITICPSTTETPMLAALREDPVTTFEQRPPLPPSLQNNQTAHICGRNLVRAVQIGDNGSVWILSDGHMKQYEFPKI